MSFLDRFKGGKHTAPDKEKEPKAKATPAASEDNSQKKQAPAKAAAQAVKQAPPKDTIAYRVLVAPLVSEKSSRLEKGRQYAFEVSRAANKVEIKKAVEKHYRVHVTGVNIVNTLGKKIRSGRTEGQRKDRRKAYVTVRAGESIVF